MDEMLRQFQALPERRQWLIGGSLVLVAIFAILYWTRLGNRRLAIKCLVLALVVHVLAWGYAHEYHLHHSRSVATKEERVLVRLKPLDRPEETKVALETLVNPRTLPVVIAPEEVVEKKTPERESPERRAAKIEPVSEVPANELVHGDTPSNQPPEPVKPEHEPLEQTLPEIGAPLPPVTEKAVPPVAPSVMEDEISALTRSTSRERVVRRPERRVPQTEPASEVPNPITVPPKHSEEGVETEVEVIARDVVPDQSPASIPPPEPLPPVAAPPISPNESKSEANPSSAGGESASTPGLAMEDEFLSKRKSLVEDPVRRRKPEPAKSEEEMKIARVLPQSTNAAPTIDAAGMAGEMAAVWRNRTAPDRLEIVIRHGGSIQTEHAVAEALAWLENHQDPRGFWDSDGFMRRCPPGDPCAGSAVETGSDNGLTGLALLAFLGAGHTHLESPKHRETVRRGLSWLMEVQQPDGDLRGNGRIYDHAMATLSLSEAYAMTKDERLLPATRKAVNWLVRAQHPQSGGWRYAPGQFGDTSVYGWVILALRSARNSGLQVPRNTWDQSQQWLRLVSSGARGGLACYRPGNQPSHAMTAEALVCRQIFGLPRNDPRMDEAGDFLLARLPDPGDYHLYYWYYGTIAMFQLGGDHWDRWNDRLSRTLLATQKTSGHARGSWDPLQPFGIDGGRVFSTACSALCLEVYYRYLPLYSTSGRGKESTGGDDKQK
ncbi:MAG: prenyltransferase/squalene oxidase repeat-containing protein [Planctomycetota bacterium]